MKITKELKQKIAEAVLEYRRENMVGAGQMSTSSMMEIYKSVGMTDKEIAEYREEINKNSEALDDPVDAYRD